MFLKKYKFQLILLFVLGLVFSLVYLFYGVNFEFFGFAMSIRVPKLIAILVVAFCICAATLIFQTLINNTYSYALFARYELALCTYPHCYRVFLGVE